MSLHMNIETNRSLRHKDGPLTGFIWVHLLSGRQGTHPSDPSLFTHPPLHSHVPSPPPTYDTNTTPSHNGGDYHDNRNNGSAWDKRVCGTPGQLKYLRDCWVEKNKQLWVFLFWELLHKDVCYFCSQKVCQCCFLKAISENTTSWRKWCVLSHKSSEKIHVCSSRLRVVLYLNNRESVTPTSPREPLICLKMIYYLFIRLECRGMLCYSINHCAHTGYGVKNNWFIVLYVFETWGTTAL